MSMNKLLFDGNRKISIENVFRPHGTFISHLLFYSFSAIRESCKAKGKVSEVLIPNFFFQEYLIFVCPKYELPLFRDFEVCLLIPSIRQKRKPFD